MHGILWELKNSLRAYVFKLIRLLLRVYAWGCYALIIFKLRYRRLLRTYGKSSPWELYPVWRVTYHPGPFILTCCRPSVGASCPSPRSGVFPIPGLTYSDWGVVFTR